MSLFRPVHVVHASASGEFTTEEIINFEHVLRICPYDAKDTIGKSQIFFQNQPQWTRIVVTETYDMEHGVMLYDNKEEDRNSEEKNAKSCTTCKYSEYLPTSEPCRHCFDGHDRWEAKDERH